MCRSRRRSAPRRIDAGALLTSHQVAALLGVHPTSVTLWIRDGHLVAGRTPGGHHRVRAAELVRFLDARRLPIPPALSQAGRRVLLVCEATPAARQSLIDAVAAYEDELELRLAGHWVELLLAAGGAVPSLIVFDGDDPGLPLATVIDQLRRSPILRTARLAVARSRNRATPGALSPDSEVTLLPKPLSAVALLRELGLSGSRP